MRRVASSLGMRRSSSFFWTPKAHHDFERAMENLSASGIAITASSILPLMRQHADLKASDIDKHMQKKLLVQRRLMQHLTPRAPLTPGVGSGSRDLPATVHRSSSGEGQIMEAVAEEPSLLVAATDAPSLTISDQLEQQRQQHRAMVGMHAQMQAKAEA